MLVEIWSDIACPWCYVGKRRFEAALVGFAHREAVTVTWRSFELDPRAPRQHDMPQPELLARKYGMSAADAQAMNARMTEAAAGEGLAFRLDDVKVGNTFDAHRLLHFADAFGKREALGERLFAAYLGEGAALGDIETLVVLAGEVGLDAVAARAVLSGDEYATAVREDEADAREIGVTGVPFFVLDRRFGISGAQSPEVLRGALEQAWKDGTP
ncbi:DsbA family oxidoreductase [Gemmatimonas sp.]|uniref:DsbA family oxidoreductase n=1 Tax=Gemmatimonas sp. TaxID=1962908 RepID=UPI00286D5509|nr:DsbA family oxidoreductase [Gemmatimonas sp.]